MGGFVNNLSDVKEDFTIIEGWAEHLHTQFSDVRDPIEQARNVGKHYPKAGEATLRKVVHGFIERLQDAVQPSDGILRRTASS